MKPVFKTRFKKSVCALALTIALAFPCQNADAQRPQNNNNNGTLQTPAPSQDAKLNKLNLPNPFELAADALGLAFAQLFKGGEQAMDNWYRNWEDGLKPALENQVKQYSTGYMDRAANYGKGLDGQTLSEAVLAKNVDTYEARKNAPFTETTCAVSAGLSGGYGGGGSNGGGSGNGNGAGGSSSNGGIAPAGHISKAITRGLSESVAQDALNAKDTPSASGPSGDIGERYAMYSRYFCDPEMNAGNAGCAPDAENPLPNADVSIENFLLKDTIDMDKEEEQLAARAIIRNLVAPSVPTPVSASGLNTGDGKNSMIKRREQQALKDMPVAVVASMVGRRSSIPNSSTATTIGQLRRSAGIAAEDISNKASLNEVLLALTRERFYSPNYFHDLAAYDEAELTQEQLGMDILTSVMLRQIYVMQEQMNGLIAARASIKHNNDRLGDLTTQLRGVTNAATSGE